MLTVSQLSKAFAGRTLFDDASLQVNRGDRIGLVGPNGAGKSTLFSLILGDASPDSGQVALEKTATIGFLPQETAAAGDETVLELAMSITPQLVRALKTIKQHESSAAGAADPGGDDRAYHSALHIFDEHGGWQLEPKAKRVLAGLAFRETDFDRPAKAMSGGWIMRAHLARLLVMEPDLLLLDEPTNHLDLESLQWFQEYLTGLSRRHRHDLARSRVLESARRAPSSRSHTRSSFVIAATGTTTWSKKPPAKSSSCPPTKTSRRKSLRSSSSPIGFAPRRAKPRKLKAS